MIAFRAMSCRPILEDIAACFALPGTAIHHAVIGTLAGLKAGLGFQPQLGMVKDGHRVTSAYDD